MFDGRENAQFTQSYARQRGELLRRAKRRLKKLLVIVRYGTLDLRKTGTGKSRVKNTLLGGEILPSGCTQVTSNIYSIEGVAVEELESMLQTNYVRSTVPKNSGHGEVCVCV